MDNGFSRESCHNENGTSKPLSALERVRALPWASDSTIRSTSVAKLDVRDVVVSIAADDESLQRGSTVLAQLLSTSAVEELTAIENKIAGWIGQQPDRAILFLADPLGQLDKAAIVLSPATRAEILRLRTTVISPAVLAGLAGLKTIAVKR
jgi:hypothetical protein